MIKSYAYVWSIMSLVVVPLSNIAVIPFKHTLALIALGIIMVCIGLLIFLIVGRYYSNHIQKL